MRREIKGRSLFILEIETMSVRLSKNYQTKFIKSGGIWGITLACLGEILVGFAILGRRHLVSISNGLCSYP